MIVRSFLYYICVLLDHKYRADNHNTTLKRNVYILFMPPSCIYTSDKKCLILKADADTVLNFDTGNNSSIMYSAPGHIYLIYLELNT